MGPGKHTEGWKAAKCAILFHFSTFFQLVGIILGVWCKCMKSFNLLQSGVQKALLIPIPWAFIVVTYNITVCHLVLINQPTSDHSDPNVKVLNTCTKYM